MGLVLTLTGEAEVLHRHFKGLTMAPWVSCSTTPLDELAHCAGNFRDGALQDPTQDCKYHKQFEDVACRPQLRLNSSLCEGAVQVRYSWGAPSCSLLYVACVPVRAFNQAPSGYPGQTVHCAGNPTTDVVCQQPHPASLVLWSIGAPL